MKRTGWIRALAMLAAIVAGVFWGYRQITPPVTLPAGFGEKEITLQQAASGPDLNLLLTHIKRMAGEAHPVDTQALLDTQNYLKEQLSLMGYSYEEQIYQLTIPEILELERERLDWGGKEFRVTEEGIRVYSGIGDKETMRLNNIIVTLDAPNTDDTIIFMAHTDSVKMGPGAFDDTVAVAAMLEGLRQLRGQTPQRDLVFLFTDGEEQGLLGAAKYVADNPGMQDITRLVINLEARGNRGALLMFETTANNLNMVREYVRGAGTPVSLSIATAVYRTMQNDTDLTRFMMAGYPGLNFAAVQGAEVYHTPLDHVDTFDRTSAAHYLSTVTGLVHHFAFTEDLTLEAAEDGVFFPLTPGRVVVMSRTVADMLAWGALALYLAVLVWQARRGLARIGTVLLTALWQLLCMGAAYGLGMLVVRQVLKAQGLESYGDILGYAQGNTVFVVLVAVFSVLAAASLMAWKKGRAQGISLMLGALLVPAVLSAATAVVFPSATYLFSLTVLSGLGVVLMHRACALGLIPAAWMLLVLLLYVPLAALVYIALSFLSAHLALVIAMLPVTLVLAFALAGDRQRVTGSGWSILTSIVNASMCWVPCGTRNSRWN